MGVTASDTVPSTSRPDGRVRGWLRTEAAYRRLAVVVTAGVAFLTVAGGAVRLTGSGLGCDDWPRCNETRFIDVSTGHAAIEQLNRLLSGVIGVPTLLFAASAVLLGRRGLRWPAFGVLAMILGNGVVGGLAVLGDLHPALVQSHFLLAMAAMGFGMVAIARSSQRWFPTSEARGAPHVRDLVGAVVVGTLLALVTGTVVTGTGPHAGDEDARRFGFDLGSVARIHSVTVIVTLLAALLLAWRAMSSRGDVPAGVRSTFSTWLFVAMLQGALGYAQYFADVPALLAGIHIAGAVALWTVTLVLALRAGWVPAGDRRGVLSGATSPA